MSDRKLIRPSMTEMMERFPARTSGRRKQVPAEQTSVDLRALQHAFGEFRSGIEGAISVHDLVEEGRRW